MTGLRWSLLMTAVALAATGCGGPRKPAPKQQESRARGPKVTSERVRLELTDASGQRVWEGSGRRLHAEIGQEQAEMRDLECRFFEQGKVVLEASAGRAEVDLSRRMITLSEDVHARSAVGRGEVRADRATWSVADRTIRASGGVEYKRGTLTATAPKLSGDTALKTIDLTDAVVGFTESTAARKTMP